MQIKKEKAKELKELRRVKLVVQEGSLNGAGISRGPKVDCDPVSMGRGKELEVYIIMERK
jgi:hypothetical protein